MGFIKVGMFGYAVTTAILGFVFGKAVAKNEQKQATPTASSSTDNKKDEIAAANAASEMKHKLFILQKDRDTLTAEVAALKEDLVAARAANDTTVETTRTQIEAERKTHAALKAKIASLEAELKKTQTELATVNANTTKRKSFIGRMF